MNRLRKYVGVAAASALLITGLGGLSPAQADSEGCVSRNEWSLVKKGWTKERVHRKFDTIGRRDYISRSGGYVDEYRTYRACVKPNRTDMSINFDNYTQRGDGLRVYSKSFSRW